MPPHDHAPGLVGPGLLLDLQVREALAVDDQEGAIHGGPPPGDDHAGAAAHDELRALRGSCSAGRAGASAGVRVAGADLAGQEGGEARRGHGVPGELDHRPCTVAAGPPEVCAEGADDGPRGDVEAEGGAGAAADPRGGDDERPAALREPRRGRRRRRLRRRLRRGRLGLRRLGRLVGCQPPVLKSGKKHRPNQDAADETCPPQTPGLRKQLQEVGALWRVDQRRLCLHFGPSWHQRLRWRFGLRWRHQRRRRRAGVCR
mmetsp:Transcript_83513/g.258226  ORF Transcript_83513/g.258226 Transcript_83513/m.258226 type:complete len:259 (-) Transcript_83513:325-1101(-)